MNRKILSAVLAAVCVASLSGCAGKNKVPENNPSSVEELYDAAIRDAAFADEDEILPLVSLLETDAMTTWKDGKVLLLTWHNYPESYPEGENVTVNWGPVWTFTDKEIYSHGDDLKSAENSEMRLKQLVSFAPDSEHSTITGFWVSPEDVKRPAYQSDPTKDDMTIDFAEDVDEEYKAWFDDNTLWSYFYGGYPWTRLGYTYDWADNGTEYGLSEFIVRDGAEVTVEFTETTDEFLSRVTGIG